METRRDILLAISVILAISTYAYMNRYEYIARNVGVGGGNDLIIRHNVITDELCVLSGWRNSASLVWPVIPTCFINTPDPSDDDPFPLTNYH